MIVGYWRKLVLTIHRWIIFNMKAIQKETVSFEWTSWISSITKWNVERSKPLDLSLKEFMSIWFTTCPQRTNGCKYSRQNSDTSHKTFISLKSWFCRASTLYNQLVRDKIWQGSHSLKLAWLFSSSSERSMYFYQTKRIINYTKHK